MVKTIWECDDCGELFNSRAARLYHRNHTCKKLTEKEDALDGKKEMTDDEVEIRTEIKQASEQGNDASEAADNRSEREIQDAIARGHVGETKTAPDDERLGTGYTIVLDDEQEPSASDDIPFVLMIPILICVLLIAGVLVFREKILEFFGGKKPKYGVPTYG